MEVQRIRSSFTDSRDHPTCCCSSASTDSDKHTFVRTYSNPVSVTFCNPLSIVHPCRFSSGDPNDDTYLYADCFTYSFGDTNRDTNRDTNCLTNPNAERIPNAEPVDTFVD